MDGRGKKRASERRSTRGYSRKRGSAELLLLLLLSLLSVVFSFFFFESLALGKRIRVSPVPRRFAGLLRFLFIPALFGAGSVYSGGGYCFDLLSGEDVSGY